MAPCLPSVGSETRDGPEVAPGLIRGVRTLPCSRLPNSAHTLGQSDTNHLDLKDVGIFRQLQELVSSTISELQSRFERQVLKHFDKHSYG